MNFFDVLTDTEEREAQASRIGGVVVGVVTNNQDSEGLGRVKLKFPWLSDEDESHWARIAGRGGIYFLPEVDDEVLVAFEHGDVRFPYVLGTLWNGRQEPPAKNEDGHNNVRLIKSRSGHLIRLNDEEGRETIEIIDKTGNNSVVFDTARNAITITADGDITLSAPRGTIKLGARQVEVSSTAGTKIEAGAGVDVKATATMNIKGATVNIN